MNFAEFLVHVLFLVLHLKFQVQGGGKGEPQQVLFFFLKQKLLIPNCLLYQTCLVFDAKSLYFLLNFEKFQQKMDDMCPAEMDHKTQ